MIQGNESAPVPGREVTGRGGFKAEKRVCESEKGRRCFFFNSPIAATLGLFVQSEAYENQTLQQSGYKIRSLKVQVGFCLRAS